MVDRRNFIYSVGSAALAAAVPLEVSALGRMALPRRAIPGSDETLAIVGLGNARVFYQGVMETSRELVRIFLEHGGSYVDTGWDARETVGKIMRENDAHEQLFLGTYIEGENLPSMRTEIRRILDVQGGESLDLVQVMAVEDFSRRRDQFAAPGRCSLRKAILSANDEAHGRRCTGFHPDQLFDDGARGSQRYPATGTRDRHRRNHQPAVHQWQVFWSR